MNELMVKLTQCRNKETNAAWNYSSNITDETEKLKTEVAAENAAFYKVMWNMDNVFIFIYIYIYLYIVGVCSI